MHLLDQWRTTHLTRRVGWYRDTKLPYSNMNSLSGDATSLDVRRTGGDPEEGGVVQEQPELLDEDEHTHYSHRAPWLRAAVLGATDGLVSVAALMLGVGGGTEELHALVLAGVAGLVGGALSMACGEYISVASQR